MPTLIAAAIAALVTLSDLARSRPSPAGSGAAAPSRSSERTPDGGVAAKPLAANADAPGFLPLILLFSGKRPMGAWR